MLHSLSLIHILMFSNVANAPAKLIKDKAKNGIPGLKAAYAEEASMLVLTSWMLS